jgi:hypothetical protein
LLIVTEIRSELMFYLNSKAILCKASNLWLKAINKSNIKIKLSKDTSKTNQNVKKDKHVIYYNFKIFIINKKR